VSDRDAEGVVKTLSRHRKTTLSFGARGAKPRVGEFGHRGGKASDTVFLLHEGIFVSSLSNLFGYATWNRQGLDVGAIKTNQTALPASVNDAVEASI
jgi:hypothetical protein